MPAISIVTDSTAQFPEALYDGVELVSSISMHIQVGDEILRDTREPRTCKRLSSLPRNRLARLLPPSVDEFVQLLSELVVKSNAVVCILSSEALCECAANARQAAEIVKGPAEIFVVDSQTTGPGLGLLVQAAAQTALKEKNGARLARTLRGLLPHVYSAFFFPSLRPLALHGHTDIAQAVAAEMLGIVPFYVLEAGRLAPVRKARSSRQVVDMLHEFAEEFEQLSHIALVQGIPLHEQDMRNLRDRLEQSFPGVPLSEHLLCASLIALFGAHTMGLVAMEKMDGQRFVIGE